MATINFSELVKQAAARGFRSEGPLEPGTYGAYINHAKVKTNAKGYDYIQTCYVGPNDKPVFDNLTYNEDNPDVLDVWVKRLTALGIARELEGREKVDLEEIAALMIGRKCQIIVRQERWDDSIRNKVTRVLPPKE
jgi:hypothetical protein